MMEGYSASAQVDKSNGRWSPVVTKIKRYQVLIFGIKIRKVAWIGRARQYDIKEAAIQEAERVMFSDFLSHDSTGR